jgi:hypothetical protein
MPIVGMLHWSEELPQPAAAAPSIAQAEIKLNRFMLYLSPLVGSRL